MAFTWQSVVVEFQAVPEDSRWLVVLRQALDKFPGSPSHYTAMELLNHMHASRFSSQEERTGLGHLKSHNVIPALGSGQIGSEYYPTGSGTLIGTKSTRAGQQRKKACAVQKNTLEYLDTVQIIFHKPATL